MRILMVLGTALLLTACRDRPLPTDRAIIGSWSWTYIEGVGRISFTADHKMTVGFPPDDKGGRSIGDSEFDIVWAGTWRLDGDVLVTKVENTPLINMMNRLDPSNLPPPEKKVERRRIVRIDAERMVFDGGDMFERVKREPASSPKSAITP